MQTLTFTQDIHNAITFSFEYDGLRGVKQTAIGYLRDYAEEGVYIMKQPGMLKDSYTAEDHAESARLSQMTPIKHGDIVEVEGKQYKVKILGNYSDAGRLIPV